MSPGATRRYAARSPRRVTKHGHWRHEPMPAQLQRPAVALPPAVFSSAAQEEHDEEENRKGLKSWALRSPARGRRGRRSSVHPPTGPPSAAQEHRAAGPRARSRQPAPLCAAAPAPVRPAALAGRIPGGGVFCARGPTYVAYSSTR